VHKRGTFQGDKKYGMVKYKNSQERARGAIMKRPSLPHMTEYGNSGVLVFRKSGLNKFIEHTESVYKQVVSAENIKNMWDEPIVNDVFQTVVNEESVWLDYAYNEPKLTENTKIVHLYGLMPLVKLIKQTSIIDKLNKKERYDNFLSSIKNIDQNKHEQIMEALDFTKKKMNLSDDFTLSAGSFSEGALNSNISNLLK